MNYNRKYLSKGIPYKTSKFMHGYYSDLKSIRKDINDIRYARLYKEKRRHRRIARLRYKLYLELVLKDGTVLIKDGKLMITEKFN